MVQRTLMLAAQVFTARDLILKNTDEDYRVAYLLLDSAAELLMVRRTDYELEAYGFKEPSPWSSNIAKVDLDDPKQRAREEAAGNTYIGWEMSNTQIRSIEREFMSKVRYLAWSDGEIAPDLVPVLKRLHDYRNEIYHNDIVRFETLSVTVKLYALVVADLLRSLRPTSISMSGTEERRLTSIFTRTKMVPPEWTSDPMAIYKGSGLFELQSMFADELVASLGSDLESVGEDLATNVETRLEDLDSNLAYGAEEMYHGENLTKWDVVRSLYWEPTGFPFVEALRRAPLRFTDADFARWAQVPDQLRESGGPLKAFTVFTEFEVEFESLEAKALKLAHEIDVHINQAIDEARGK